MCERRRAEHSGGRNFVQSRTTCSSDWYPLVKLVTLRANTKLRLSIDRRRFRPNCSALRRLIATCSSQQRHLWPSTCSHRHDTLILSQATAFAWQITRQTVALHRSIPAGSLAAPWAKLSWLSQHLNERTNRWIGARTDVWPVAHLRPTTKDTKCRRMVIRPKPRPQHSCRYARQLLLFLAAAPVLCWSFGFLPFMNRPHLSTCSFVSPAPDVIRCGQSGRRSRSRHVWFPVFQGQSPPLSQFELVIQTFSLVPSTFDPFSAT